MAKLTKEKVTNVFHWNDSVFSFKTTRSPSFRFKAGQFVVIGLEIDGVPLLRAYSVVSAPYEEQLEFLSIKVQNGPLTSRLQHLKLGDEVIIGSKATGNLTCSGILPGKNLFLLSTGTGIAPFMSIIRDPETYQQFGKVILVHCCRKVNDLAYNQYLEEELGNHELLGDTIKQQFMYYPTVTREDYKNVGRIPDLITADKLFHDIRHQFKASEDRALLCGSIFFIDDTRKVLAQRGLRESTDIAHAEFAIERAFTS